MSELTYRLLHEDEWGRVQAIFAGHSEIPDRSLSQIAIAERDGKIVGMLVCQPAIHSEPLWIDEQERGKVSWKRMVGMFGDNPQGVYVFAPNERIARMCELAGFEQLDYKVFLRKGA